MTKQLTELNVTEIQIFFDSSATYDEAKKNVSASIAIDNCWMILRGTDGEYSIPHSSEACWNDACAQDRAYEEENARQVAYACNLDSLVEGAFESEWGGE